MTDFIDPSQHPSKVRNAVRIDNTLNNMIFTGKEKIGVAWNEKTKTAVRVSHDYDLRMVDRNNGWVVYRLSIRHHNSRHIRLYNGDTPISSPIPTSELQGDPKDFQLNRYLRPQPGEPREDAKEPDIGTILPSPGPPDKLLSTVDLREAERRLELLRSKILDHEIMTAIRAKQELRDQFFKTSITTGRMSSIFENPVRISKVWIDEYGRAENYKK